MRLLEQYFKFCVYLWRAFKMLFLRFVFFLKSVLNNWPCFLWSAFCFTLMYYAYIYLFYETIRNHVTVILIFGVLPFFIAMSPIGESIMRFYYKAKPLNDRYKAKALSAFEEVLNQALMYDMRIKKGTALFMEMEMSPNAFALGVRTVAITKGAIEAFTIDDLKGLCAHELGHLANRYCWAKQFMIIFNFAFILLVWVCDMGLRFINWCVAMTLKTRSQTFLIVKLFNWAVKTVLTIPPSLFSLMILANGRANEYSADLYAFELGYGEELINVLYKLQNLSKTERKGFFKHLKNSHPYIEDRIYALEQLSAGYQNGTYRYSMAFNSKNKRLDQG